MRNLYALTPGELLVGQQLEARGYQIYIPTKDKGIDLLATKDSDVLRFQVKESRVYLHEPRRVHRRLGSLSPTVPSGASFR